MRFRRASPSERLDPDFDRLPHSRTLRDETTEAESSDLAEERLVPNWEGAVIGRYRIGPRLGAGGMGQVHLAMMNGAAGFSRVVAVKRLHSAYSHDPNMRARFEQEVRLSACIVHPNVVQVLDVIHDGDDLMFVMEFVPGDTLRAMRGAAADAKEYIALDVAAGIVVLALHGLHAAHETRDAQGKPLLLVHRDFSPDNVLIGPDGEVKVLDFGVAKVAQEALMTKPGCITGKLCYMSPEQALGLPLNARSDIFSAGAVLWELLTGERLFRSRESSPVAILQKVLSEEITPPSRLRPDLPAALEAVVMRALERDVEARFQSALDFALALGAAIPPASAFSIGQSLQKFCNRSLRERAIALERFRSTAPSQQRPLELTSALALHADPGEVSLWGNDGLGELALIDSAPPAAVAPRKNSSGFWRAVAAVALLGGVVGIVWWRWPVASPRARETTVRASAAAASETGTAPSNEARPIVAQPEPPSVAKPTASASPSALPLPAEPTGKARVRSFKRQPRLAATCNPPTYVSADGIRHFKPECL